jgi:hypothetical protein
MQQLNVPGEAVVFAFRMLHDWMITELLLVRLGGVGNPALTM